MRYILILLCCLLPTAVFAKIPSDESVKQLMEIQKIRDIVIDGLSATLSQEMIAVQVFPFLRSEKDTKIDVENRWNEMLKMDEIAQEKFRHDFKTNPKMIAFIDEFHIQPMFKDYKEKFTQDEIDAMIGFYETPIGQSIIQKELMIAYESVQEDSGFNEIDYYVKNYENRDEIKPYVSPKEKMAEALEEVYFESSGFQYMASEMFRLAEVQNNNAK